VRDSSVAGTAFADTFFRRLVFNGKSALENGHDYQEIVVDSNGGTSTEQVAQQIGNAAPTFVIELGPPELVPEIERNLPRAAGSPVYVLVNNDASPLGEFIRRPRRQKAPRVFRLVRLEPDTECAVRHSLQPGPTQGRLSRL